MSTTQSLSRFPVPTTIRPDFPQGLPQDLLGIDGLAYTIVNYLDGNDLPIFAGNNMNTIPPSTWESRLVHQYYTNEIHSIKTWVESFAKYLQSGPGGEYSLAASSLTDFIKAEPYLNPTLPDPAITGSTNSQPQSSSINTLRLKATFIKHQFAQLLATCLLLNQYTLEQLNTFNTTNPGPLNITQLVKICKLFTEFNLGRRPAYKDLVDDAINLGEGLLAVMMIKNFTKPEIKHNALQYLMEGLMNHGDIDQALEILSSLDQADQQWGLEHGRVCRLQLHNYHLIIEGLVDKKEFIRAEEIIASRQQFQSSLYVILAGGLRKDGKNSEADQIELKIDNSSLQDLVPRYLDAGLLHPARAVAEKIQEPTHQSEAWRQIALAYAGRDLNCTQAASIFIGKIIDQNARRLPLLKTLKALYNEPSYDDTALIHWLSSMARDLNVGRNDNMDEQNALLLLEYVERLANQNGPDYSGVYDQRIGLLDIATKLRTKFGLPIPSHELRNALNRQGQTPPTSTISTDGTGTVPNTDTTTPPQDTQGNTPPLAPPPGETPTPPPAPTEGSSQPPPLTRAPSTEIPDIEAPTSLLPPPSIARGKGAFSQTKEPVIVSIINPSPAPNVTPAPKNGLKGLIQKVITAISNFFKSINEKIKSALSSLAGRTWKLITFPTRLFRPVKQSARALG